MVLLTALASLALTAGAMDLRPGPVTIQQVVSGVNGQNITPTSLTVPGVAVITSTGARVSALGVGTDIPASGLTVAAGANLATVSGSVGVGMSNPTVTLGVGGTAEASGHVRATGWTTGTEGGPAAELGYTGGTAFLMGYSRSGAAWQPLQAEGVSFTAGPFVNPTALVLDGSGHATVNGSLTVAGSSTTFGGDSGFTTTSYEIPPKWTLAQIRAATPASTQLGGIVSCTDCASPYSVCQSTGATIQGFRLGLTGTTECK